MAQFNKLIEFRQTIYDRGLSKAKDAQFELVDALLLSPPIRSYPELSLSPVFRRRWPSVYTAIEDGEHDVEWLESYFTRQIARDSVQVFSLDGTAWPHTAARVLEDRQYVYSPTIAIDGGSIVIGHPYSVLAWAPERNSSWAPPISVRRIKSQQTCVEVGVEQVRQLCRHRREEMHQVLHIIAADGKYGNHRFLRSLKDEPCGKIVRLRCDRVLYDVPGPYSGKGRPRVHGDRFAFKEHETWSNAAATAELEDERWGKVRLRRWDTLHAREDAATSFSVILVETHLEREKPCKPFWLAYQSPPDQEPADQTLSDLWYWYQHRWPVEPSIRFRKQYLHWTLPRFQEAERCDRWTMLVSLAQWQLFLARGVVRDQPLPWQSAQENLTPERVLQSLGGLFRQISTPAAPPQTRGKSPGWTPGRPRRRPMRYPVIKKTTAKPITS